MAEQLLDTGRRRLEAMDAAGIDIAVLSLAAPCIQDEFDGAQAATGGRRGQRRARRHRGRTP